MKKETKVLRVSDLVGVLRARAPFDLAEDWDNVGLLAGDPGAAASGVIASVNLGAEALEAAREHQANVVVCHHPPIFKPISKLTKATHPYLYEALRRGISVIALHTNFDLAALELNRSLAQQLGARYLEPLAARGSEKTPPSRKFGKFVTFVPEKDLEKVRQALCAAGAGYIGNYSHCTFSTLGEGTFWGHEDTHPAIGKAGRLERAREMRLETIFPWKIRDKVVAAAQKAHPYEEMAYDIYEVLLASSDLGYGFVGKTTDLVFHKFLARVKRVFQLRNAVVVGPALTEKSLKVRKIAFSPGAGSSFIGSATAKGVDVYVCGEVGYHQMLDAKRSGLTLIVLGHSYSERFFVETVAEWCVQVSGRSGFVKKVFETVHEVR